MAITLTQEQIDKTAGRAWFFFLVYDYYNLYLDAAEGDATVITGQGVDTLDQIIGFFERPFPSRFTIDLDVGGVTPDMRRVNVDDVRAIKTAYIALWGDVSKPNVYPPTPGPYE